ncbi:hypothetical protein BU15DRAFT_66618 [Melanogaster broomeanus]|nr:hypothetical protein BU15DRAFT_66618 [Melanogaster broomeanus]
MPIDMKHRGFGTRLRTIGRMMVTGEKMSTMGSIPQSPITMGVVFLGPPKPNLFLSTSTIVILPRAADQYQWDHVIPRPVQYLGSGYHSLVGRPSIYWVILPQPIPIPRSPYVGPPSTMEVFIPWPTPPYDWSTQIPRLTLNYGHHFSAQYYGYITWPSIIGWVNCPQACPVIYSGTARATQLLWCRSIPWPILIPQWGGDPILRPTQYYGCTISWPIQ